MHTELLSYADTELGARSNLWRHVGVPYSHFIQPYNWNGSDGEIPIFRLRFGERGADRKSHEDEDEVEDGKWALERVLLPRWHDETRYWNILESTLDLVVAVDVRAILVARESARSAPACVCGINYPKCASCYMFVCSSAILLFYFCYLAGMMGIGGGTVLPPVSAGPSPLEQAVVTNNARPDSATLGNEMVLLPYADSSSDSASLLLALDAATNQFRVLYGPCFAKVPARARVGDAAGARERACVSIERVCQQTIERDRQTDRRCLKKFLAHITRLRFA